MADLPRRDGPLLTSDASPQLRRLATGAVVSFLGRVCGAFLKYITQVSIALFLGAQSFGIYALGITVYQFGELFARLGLTSGAVRYAAMHHGAGDDARLTGLLKQAARIPFVGGMVVGLILFFTAGTLALQVFDEPSLAPVLRIMAVALPFGAAMIVTAFATTGFQVTRYLVYIRDLIHPGVNLLLVLLLCALGFGLLGAAAAWLAAAILGFIVAVLLVRSIYPPLADRRGTAIYETRSLLSFSIPLALGQFFSLMLLWTDILMLGYYRSAEEVGVYRAVSQSALFVPIFLGSLNTIFAPMIADLYNKGAIDRMRSIFQTSTRWSLLLSAPVFLLFVIDGEEIMRVFGPEFVAGTLPLIVLSTGQLINAGAGAVGYMLIMSGHQNLKMAGDLLFAFLNLILNALLIPRWGLMGAATATSVSIAGLNVLRTLQVYHVLHVQDYNWRYLKIAAAAVAALAAGLVTDALLPGAHFLVRLALCVASIGAVNILTLWLLGFEEADQIVFDQVRKRLKYS